MKVTEIYVAVNANRNSTCQIFDCDPHENRVAYGANNAILIYDLNQEKITHTLLHHQGRVNAVKWMKTKTVNNKCQKTSCLLSAGNDGNVIAWLPTKTLLPSNDNGGHLEFHYQPTVLDPPTSLAPPTLKTAKKSVNLIDSCQIDNDSDVTAHIVASAGIDVTCALRLWKFETNVKNGGTYHLIDTFEFGNSQNGNKKCQKNNLLLTAVRLIDSKLCACALDNSKIVLLLRNNDTTWQQCHELTGHTDWVTDLDVKRTVNDKSTVIQYSLASSSQDLTVRLWELSLEVSKTGQQFLLNCQLDSIIQGGHEDWIYSVKWHKNGRQLLTASVDRSIILWQFDQMTGLWREQLRLGDIIGFYGANFHYNDSCSQNKLSNVSVIAVSYYGTLHRWRLLTKIENNRNDTNDVITIDSYESLSKIGGHFDAVTDITWSKNGRVLLSASADRTVRCHAPFHFEGELGRGSWHEMARPQIHGYAINCLTALTDDSYASGADEKIVRIFQAPHDFQDNVATLLSSKSVNNRNNKNVNKVSMPVLGLSNKYVEEKRRNVVNDEEDESTTLPIVTKKMTVPPTEEFLMEKSLWAELRKLYAHGNEIQCMAVTNDMRILATASRATSKRHAVIILWGTAHASWQPLQQLADGHQLTVVQMTFAPDDSCLLSVSRDRSAILWTRLTTQKENDSKMTDNDNKNDSSSTSLFQLTVRHDRWHKRIIWACAFTHDSRYYVTGSRDGRVAWWAKKEGAWWSQRKEEDLNKEGAEPISSMEFNKTSSVTSLTCAPSNSGKKGAYLFAIGFECGNIVLCQLSLNFDVNLTGIGSCQILMDFSQHTQRPHGRVNRLTFRPLEKGRGPAENDNQLFYYLACASSDMSVRIYEIKE